MKESRQEHGIMENDILQKIIELRHELHRHPELSHEEKGTIRTLQRFLRENTSFELTDRDGWFYALVPGTQGGDAIAFRADMDALPIPEGIALPYASVNEGVSHKCGHDGHSAALCGLAMELERRPPARTVYLIFQPAEEVGGGGETCARLLREKKIREVYAFHNFSGYPEGSVVFRRGLTQPASEGLTVRLHGRCTHASAPEKGINPAVAVAQLALFSETLARQYDGGMALCTLVGMNAGTGDFGIAAGDGSLCVTLRAEEESVMKDMERQLLERAQSLADAQGLQPEHSVCDYFPETRNHDEALDRVLACARALGLETYEMQELWRASEDFGYYLRECSGAMFYLGNGTDYPALHTVPYDFNDAILPRAVDLFAALAHRQ